MSRISIVVPCYNEAKRFDEGAFARALGEVPSLDFIFVDDGSVDETLAILRAFELEHEGRVRVINSPLNLGK
ncbi:MAG: glycosyltransferase family 2 protein, partial [bacterium]